MAVQAIFNAAFWSQVAPAAGASLPLLDWLIVERAYRVNVQ
jgi:hypothetical protein